LRAASLSSIDCSLDSESLSGNNRYLCKYLSLLIGQRYDIKVTLKLEQISSLLQPLVSEKLYDLEMNDPQVIVSSLLD
jgi:hypothetical protein